MPESAWKTTIRQVTGFRLIMKVELLCFVLWRGIFSVALACCLLPLRLFSAPTEIVHYQRLISLGVNNADANQPWWPLFQGRGGTLYGTSYLGGSNGLGTVFKLQTDGSGYFVLHQFGVSRADGQNPYAGVIEGSDGWLYGTASAGGTGGRGIVYKMQPDGSGYTVLRNFTGTGTDGSGPFAELLEASDGVLYGTTWTGGGLGYNGTLFALNKDGSNYRQLHRFGMGSDGATPECAPLEGADGMLYGTCVGGGIFRLNKDGTGYASYPVFGESQVYQNSLGRLLQGSDGELYGVATFGQGGVYKLKTDGTGFQILYTFDGDRPFGALVKGRDGALYGTTFQGPIVGPEYGTIFRLNKDGSEFRVVYQLSGTLGDGQHPVGLLLGADGAFYGTTFAGGEFNKGTVFRLLVNHSPVARSADTVVSADSNCVAQATVDNGSFDPDGDPITLSQSPPGPYPLGTNVVTLTVTDTYGDSNSCTATVVVLDTTPPMLQCPSNVTIEFISPNGAPVTYTASAMDNCDSNPQSGGLPPSGTTFPIGVTPVQCTAVDASGNSAGCSFTVTVLGARGVKQDVLNELTSLRDALTGAGVTGKSPAILRLLLDKAIAELAASLDPALWVDETHVQPLLGLQVFEEEKSAMQSLCALILPDSSFPNTVLEDFIHRISRADRLLAWVAIQDSIASGTPPDLIELAEQALAQGDTDTAANRCSGAIEHYRLAWQQASGGPHN